MNTICKREYWDKIDLHIHSNYSDSSRSIEEIVDIALSKGLSAISISDHDTVKQCLKAQEFKDKIRIINGIEISAFDSSINKEVHILGYDFDLPANNIVSICENTIKLKDENCLWQISRLNELGYEIDESKVRKFQRNSECLYKQHILNALFEEGLITDIFDDFYHEVYRKELKKKFELPSVEDVINAIHKDNGKVFIAHPFLSGIQDSLVKYIALGIDGIEVKHSKANEKEVEYLYELSIKNNLLMSKGSDNHGIYGTESEIGS